MNSALWRKAVSAAWMQLVVYGVLLVLFGWLFVWLMGLFKLGAWASFLNMLPDFSQRIMGIPIGSLATPTGQISILYVHVITILIFIGWAIGRGSDAISGEIARGTMDLTATLPVRRTALVFVPAVVATIGAVMLAAAIWGGTWLGLLTTGPDPSVSARQFLPGAINLFAMTFCLTGLTAFISSWNRDRWRTISIAVALFVVSLIVKMVARLWEPGAWLKYLSFLSAFDPQRLIVSPEQAWSLSLRYDATLLGLGLAGYLAAAVIFSRRDIPAAL
jgi:ABC-2 type transport system permease protein